MQSDEQLIERVQRGDRPALGELFERYQKPLFNFFQRGFGHAEDAEDLTMETLLRAFRNAGQFRGVGSFKAWLYHLALNVARDRARRTRRRPEVTASGVGEQWALVEDDRREKQPEEMALRSAVGEAVRAAIRDLPERERVVLILREYHELSYTEICAAARMPLPTVKMTLLRARRRVRERLQAAGGRAGAVELCL